MDTIWQDVRYGLRVLLKNPGFTVVAVLTLALGIGAGRTIFSSVNAIVIHPLPFKGLNELVLIWETLPKPHGGRVAVAPANFLDWRNQNQVFERMAAYQRWEVNLTGVGEPERLQGCLVSAAFFSLLGMNVSTGRTFLAEEAQPGQDRVIVMSNGLWQRRFGADLKLVGESVKLNGRNRTVVGVMPPDFDFPLGTDLWAPLALSNEEKAQRGTHNLLVMARLKPGVSVSKAEAEMSLIASRLGQQFAQTNAGGGVRLRRMREELVRGSGQFALFLMASAGFVLLLACANVANLQLARDTARQKEIAMRIALGASRARVLTQLLTESLLLSLFGGVPGLLLAMWGVDLMKAGVPPDITKYVAGLRYIRMDAQVFGFALGMGKVGTDTEIADPNCTSFKRLSGDFGVCPYFSGFRSQKRSDTAHLAS